MIKPQSLRKGAKIGVISTARKISKDEIGYAQTLLKSWGFIPVLGDALFEECWQFAGTDDQRLKDLQFMLDNKDIDAIICARGGYGTSRIIDGVDLTAFMKQPKWIAGYSDVTVLHSHIQSKCGVQTLHASMPINFSNNTKEALDSLKIALTGNPLNYKIIANELNKKGNAEGMLTGGNLSILYSLVGTSSDIDTENKILFIEDVDEYLYHIDRMMVSLKRSGKLSNLRGLIVGSMNKMHDNDIPFGNTANEIIWQTVKEFDYPVCFGFPAGHIDDNRTLIFGNKIILKVDKEVEVWFT